MTEFVGGGKRILIVNVNWIGDVIFSTPFIKAVREAYPDGHIACLIHPRCADILKDNPRIDEIIIYDEEGRHRGIMGKLRLARHIRKGRFDTAFILHRSFTKAFLTFIAGIKKRVGYPTKHRDFLLTKAIDLPDHEIHKVEYFLNLARGAGINARENAYEFFVTDEDRGAVNKFLKQNGVEDKDRIVVLCPGGNWDPKRWPGENFALLADMLIESLGVKIVLSGAEKDISLARNIRNMMKNTPITSCGATTLKELGCLLERARLVIANDSGPMHLAVAMKTNVIALFGPTSPELTGPYGKGNYTVLRKIKGCEIPCYDVTCTDNRCMKLITVGDVFEEAKKFIADSS
jgi:lipopolysaccharide heptosyltransferase II